MPLDFKTAVNIAKRNPKTYKILRKNSGSTDIVRNTSGHIRVYNFDRKRKLINIMHKYENGIVIQNHYNNEKYTGTWLYAFKGIMKKFGSIKEYITYFKKELPSLLTTITQ